MKGEQEVLEEQYDSEAEGDPSAENIDKTIAIDRTVVSIPHSQNKSSRKKNSVFFPNASTRTRNFSTARTGMFSFRKLRDVDSRIEELRSKLRPGEVDFDHVQLELNKIDSEYEVGEQIAEGGQGTLFRGRDRKLRRVVAIKSLNSDLIEDAHQRELFENEAKITAQLDHPAIVPIYTLNTDDRNGLHLAMKLINGETLKAYLEQICTHYKLDGVSSFDEAKSLRNRLEIFLKICDALEYAHSRNVMHCDLKPANIMIGEYHEAYIMDWGIARPIHTDNPPKEIAGTPQYIAPELANGQPGDQRSDIFSMGVILFEIVMLKPAFTGESPDEYLERIRTGMTESYEHFFGARVGKDLKAIIQKALQTDPAIRYQNIGELASDLRRYLQDQEVSARPDNPFMKAIRWCHRHRRLILSLLLVTLFLNMATVTFLFYQQYRFAEATRRRDATFGKAFSTCVRAAHHLDEQFLKLSQMTELLSSDISLLLKSSIQSDEENGKYYQVGEFQNMTTPTMLHSAFFRNKVDPSALLYNFRPDSDQVFLKKRLETLSIFLPRLLHMVVLGKQNDNIDPKGLESLIRKTFTEGSPVLRVIFGFNDGVYITYPAEKNLPLDYDPRVRSWYKGTIRMTKFGTRWTKPYVDGVPGIGLVLSCCSPIYLDHKPSGACAVDVSISALINTIQSTGNLGGYVEEKAIVSANREVIISTTKSFAQEKILPSLESDDSITFNKFATEQLFEKMKKSRFGIVTAEENGEEKAYAFYYIQSVNWFYVEKMNLNYLLEAFGD